MARRKTEPTSAKGVTDDLRSRVIDLYKSETKLAEITRQTSVPRATIYWILKQEGVTPNRVKVGSDGPSVAELVNDLREAEREIGSLRARLAEAERCAVFYRYIAMFMDQIGLQPPPGCQAWVPDITAMEVDTGRQVLEIQLKSPARPRTTSPRRTK